MPRRIFLMGSIVLLSLSLVVAQGRALEKVRLGTPVKGHLLFELPAIAAEEQGFWEQNGLAVEWFSFGSGAAEMQAASAGSIDVALITAETIIQGISRGVPAVIVATTAFPDKISVWVRGDSHIKRPEDLRGATIAITRFGGLDDAFSRFIARVLGMEKEIKIVAAGGMRESIAMLQVGKVDAKITSELSMLPLFGKIQVRQILSINEYLPKPWMYQILYARKEFAAKNPATMRKFLRAYGQSTAFIIKGRSWAIDMLKSSRYGHSEELAEMYYERLPVLYTSDLRVDRAGVKNVRDFLIEYGIVKSEQTPPVEELFTNRFVE